MKYLVRSSVKFIIPSIFASLLVSIIFPLLIYKDVKFSDVFSLIALLQFVTLMTVALVSAGNQKYCIDELLGPDHDNDYSVNQTRVMTIESSVEKVKDIIVNEINKEKPKKYELKIDGIIDETSIVLKTKWKLFGKNPRKTADEVFVSIRGILRDNVEVTIHSRSSSKYVLFDKGRNLERILNFEKELKSIS